MRDNYRYWKMKLKKIMAALKKGVIGSVIESIGWKNRGDWANLNAVGRVERSREIDGKVSIERSEFLYSFTDLEKFSRVVRGHWGSENQQHGVLDTHFEDDKNRIRADHARENLALMRNGIEFNPNPPQWAGQAEYSAT